MSAPHRRPALIILVIVAALACLGLGWWQWGRFESSSGTAQNLGYALQWPLFAAFVVFAYFRFVRLERETREDETQATPAETPRSAKSVAPREIPAGLLPERPKAAHDDDPVLAEYNRYLAELNARDPRASIAPSERSAG
ncbi:DNA-binding transcriptional regulator of glucitol operon [Nocardia transvalensis]|uniref:DNA-binding transcriptional regulator of glucitol operon n=1 Tax=Nocardia transvalensis TaxID=37333 RepID=A0A7W9PG38_9NOCA|nr:glucitol operon activator [Nocardia transvalensis]MBB5914978.1 DNA-binding transcriptional regulator of glucitol operon [Nocardia transvalensis]